MIVDTSIIVAIALNEPTLAWIGAQFKGVMQGEARMSWVNIAEAGMTLNKSVLQRDLALGPLLAQSGIVPLDIDNEIVELAIAARARFPLNFGDCFAYAHARLRDDALITLDADFLKTDLPRIFHPDRS